MEALFSQVRPPVDDFERLLISVFGALASVEAIWVRDVPRERCALPHPHAPDDFCAGGPTRKPKTKSAWLQLDRKSIADIGAIQRLHDEIQIRIISQPFGFELRYVHDELPPGSVLPSCIFRRGHTESKS